MFSEYLLAILEAEVETKITKAVEKYNDLVWAGPGEDLEKRDEDLEQFAKAQIKKVKNEKIKSRLEKKISDKFNLGETNENGSNETKKD